METGTACFSGVAKIAERLDARSLDTRSSTAPAGMTARPAEVPRTRKDPVTARSPLMVMVPVRDEMLDARSSNSRRPTLSLPTTVKSAVCTG